MPLLCSGAPSEDLLNPNKSICLYNWEGGVAIGNEMPDVAVGECVVPGMQMCGRETVS